MSYKYSPIKRIQIKNFRNIGEVELSFDESPIISLIGENEAGKTSVVKAFSVCALHSTPRDQKDFIRDGTGGFGVAIQLDDGTIVTRIKTPTLNRYTVTRPDGNNFDTTKIEGGLPPAVQEVMGLIEEAETKEYLQVRTYEDQLLFVVTPASTNYKVMYDALKVDQITRAIKIGSKEANALRASIDSNNTGIDTLTNSLRAIRIVDIGALISIRERLNKELRELDELNSIVSNIERIKQCEKSLGALSEISKLDSSEINEREALAIIEIGTTLGKIRELEKKHQIYEKSDHLEQIDDKVYTDLLGAYNRKIRIDAALKESQPLRELSSIEEIDDSIIRRLIDASVQSGTIKNKSAILSIIEPDGASDIGDAEINCINTLSDMLSLIAMTSQLESNYAQIDDYCIKVQEYLKAIGAAVEICPNCGSDIVIDMDKYR